MGLAQVLRGIRCRRDAFWSVTRRSGSPFGTTDPPPTSSPAFLSRFRDWYRFEPESACNRRPRAVPTGRSLEDLDGSPIPLLRLGHATGRFLQDSEVVVASGQVLPERDGCRDGPPINGSRIVDGPLDDCSASSVRPSFQQDCLYCHGSLRRPAGTERLRRCHGPGSCGSRARAGGPRAASGLAPIMSVIIPTRS